MASFEEEFSVEIAELLVDFENLITDLIPTIEDDYRASEEDEVPGMQLTVSVDDLSGDWNYQTGDNSYTGGCYGDSYWAVTSIYRDTNAKDVAGDLMDQLLDQIEEC